MAKCLVVGGGFAGLSTAVFLSRDGHSVKLIEASPKLGGRAYSFTYEKQKTIVDNGQHILMGCYLNTLEFLDLIGSRDLISIQTALKINFIAEGGKRYLLDTEGVTYPFNILSSLKNYDALTKTEKFSAVKLFLKIAVLNPINYTDQTTKQFLDDNNQSENAVKALWEIIHVGTMNSRLNESSAEIFLRVLKQIFFTINDSTKIILPAVGLSEMYCEQSEEYIINNGGSVSISEKLISIDFDDSTDQIKSITTSKAEYTDYDYIMLTIPPDQCEKIFDKSELRINLPEYKYSPILNLHLWLNSYSFKEKFYGFIDSKIHWMFVHEKHVTLTISAASEFIELSEEEIVNSLYTELKRFFPQTESSNVIDHLVVKEKRATFISSPNNTKERSTFLSKRGNLIFAGDWTNTGFPATIEGAVKSAKIVLDNIS